MMNGDYMFQTFVGGIAATRWRTDSEETWRDQANPPINPNPRDLPNAQVWMAYTDEAALARMRNLHFVTHDCPTGLQYSDGICERKLLVFF